MSHRQIIEHELAAMIAAIAFIIVLCAGSIWAIVFLFRWLLE